MPIDNNTSIKEYNQISKCKDMEIEIEKVWHLKTTAEPVIVGALDMIKKREEKHINKIPVCTNIYMKYKKNHFGELFIFLGEYYQDDLKISPERSSKKT